MKKTFNIFLLTVLFFLSCAKQADMTVEADRSKPLIKVYYPLDVPALPKGFPLCIKILVTDNRNLSSVWLEINDSNGYQVAYPVSGKSIEIIEKYIAPPDARGEFIARFHATDEAGNTSTQDIRFTIDN